MTWSISDLFPPWGDAGERPADNFQYDGGDQVNEKHFDYLWDNAGNLENEIRSALTDIDSDKDGVVDRANEGASPFTVFGDIQDSQATPKIIWDDANKEIPDSALGTIDTTTLAADSDNNGVIDEAESGSAPFTALGDIQDSQATPVTIWDDANKWIPTTILQADSDGDGLVEDYDESLIKDGGTREVDASELAGGLGTSGEFLKTDGADAAWASPPTSDIDWTLDQTATATDNASFTITLNSNWDEIYVDFDEKGTLTDGTQNVGVQFNGVTTSTYHTVFGDGTTSSTSEIVLGKNIDGNLSGNFIVRSYGNHTTVEGNLTQQNDGASSVTNVADKGNASGVTKQLSSLTLNANSSTDWTVAVYGRNRDI